MLFFWAWNIKMPFWNGTPPICILNIVYMTAGKCRDPKSLNGIELSRFVQKLLQFYWFEPPPAPREGTGGGWGYLGTWGCPHTHMHACTHTCKEIAKATTCLSWCCPHGPHVISVIPMLFPSSPHHPEGPYIIPNPPDSHYTTPTQGRAHNQSKFNKIWTNWDILILFEDLKSVKTPPPIGCAWVGGEWVNGWGQVKSLKIK